VLVPLTSALPLSLLSLSVLSVLLLLLSSLVVLSTLLELLPDALMSSLIADGEQDASACGGVFCFASTVQAGSACSRLAQWLPAVTL
jgi:hypothetical protein